MRILSLEVGTSSVKAVVLDVESATPTTPIVRVDYELDRPVPEAVEVPADRLWAAVTQAARQATRGQEGIEGVGLCCLAPALVLLNARDQPFVPIRMPLDRRARPAARQVWAAAGEEFLNSTGIRPLPGGCSAVNFRQILTMDAYLYREVKSYLHVNGWLGWKLTGEKRFDPANASLTGLFNTMTDHQWSPRWMELFNIDPAWMSPVVSAAATLGPLRSAVAVELGVPPGLPVKLGTTDLASSVLAARMKPGDLLHIVGATQTLTALAPNPHPDARRVTALLGVGDSYLHVTHNPVGGEAFDWLYRLCFLDQTKEQFVTKTMMDALDRPTRVTLDPPYLGGDRLEIEAHRAGFRDLTLSTERMDLLSALLQEMRRQHRKALDALGVGDHFTRIFMAGEGAEVVQRLLPEYEKVEFLTEGPLRGVARLFQGS